jgi:Atg29 N-terminal domain
MTTRSDMPDVENHFTVFIRLPFDRGDFVDPPPARARLVPKLAFY